MDTDLGRPVKRRRVEIPCPDGFISDSKPIQKTKMSVPKFSSAFDEDCKGKKKKKNVAQLRPAPPPPQMTSHSSTVPLKQVFLPAFAVQSSPKVSLKAHKPLPPPALPTSRKMADDKDLRTISTTAIGRLTALSSENGGEDLAAILLRDQHPDIPTAESHHADDTSRGLQMSPEKKGKGNNPKYIRGGLAARASTFFDRSKTSLLLWQKGIEHRSKGLPDLSATVVKVLHEPTPPSRRSTSKSLPLSPGIALCRIHEQKEHKKYASDQFYRILFSFSSSPFPERFREGQNVRIYWPWQEVSFTQTDPQPSSDDSHSRLPASLPLPLSLPSTPDFMNVPINDTTLLCSRFLIP